VTLLERFVGALLARGRAIDGIAQTLWVSRHTVRDHVKSIFTKLDVSSRPELTAKLFAEQFLPCSRLEPHSLAISQASPPA
jgi:DNA-binding CsgD family transcriptional regulator